ncbi:bifunctional phosphoribosylaminoimidazolecarboxamide formyltransferase/IMP cyclohydrolase [Sutterella sp.]|uniref:bifunctional phosphoribosylaminoimidazolecarboxamide formyltransferase/IMP cyclohydrolase n=1 Tax=Sutterella sp. TaxID=1981025 RepID=UPI0026DEAB71|nr:bifunctional phosphoribosylaminoimidazolecarboxamide formyltransferase/IMP cyclohydrolase [Sutterella sp.]MDO5531015.1 bifunctional phosphoribosylaminoimidazolecarboxamide formyltransferase/IMP cyclohydrolase [Sutterella sp.]
MRKQALLSVSDKTGIVDFARGLVEAGYHILSTGGTAKLLAKEGIEVEEVAHYTGFPEMLDGRVKTLNPKIHAGILARRPSEEHMAALAAHGIDPIDIVCVNLYPFEQTVARPDCTLEDAIENIDIGGPTMIRAAAKNCESVAVVVDPADYDDVLEEIRATGGVEPATRFALAKKVFAHTARYDGMITNYLTSLDEENHPGKFPEVLTRQWEKVQDLRYGENPHQSGAFYREVHVAPGLLAGYEQLQGKELSYNNIADSDAAWECVRSFEAPACVIIKHANPCGVAVAENCEAAYAKAFLTDSKSAFGGIIAFNGPVTLGCAEKVSHQFAEVIIAPEFEPAALELFSKKKNLRLLKIARGRAHNDFDFKRVGGGILVQSPDIQLATAEQLRCVTEKQPTQAQIIDLLFAWNVARFVKSNTIVYARDGMTLGVGAGQMSRVDSARIAAIKAEEGGLSLVGSVAASDAFFPFRDGLDVVVDAGCTAVIQPGGSIRDQEVIDAANERGIAMVFTGERHFRH